MALATVPFNAFAELMAIAMTFVAFVSQMFAALMMLTGFPLLPFTVLLTAFLMIAKLSPIFVDFHDIIWRRYSDRGHRKRPMPARSGSASAAATRTKPRAMTMRINLPPQVALLLPV